MKTALLLCGASALLIGVNGAMPTSSPVGDWSKMGALGVLTLVLSWLMLKIIPDDRKAQTSERKAFRATIEKRDEAMTKHVEVFAATTEKLTTENRQMVEGVLGQYQTTSDRLNSTLRELSTNCAENRVQCTEHRKEIEVKTKCDNTD